MAIKISANSNSSKKILATLKQNLPKNWPYPLHITLNEQHISLEDDKKNLSKLNISFIDNKTIHLQNSITKRQPLYKALNLKKNKEIRETIVDATAGFGQDSFLLAHTGLNVISIEQNPIVSALLQAAVEMYKIQNPNILWQVVCANSELWLSQNYQHTRIDYIYIDPFFYNTKTAKPKNNMQWLQELNTNQKDNSIDIFNQARKSAHNKIIIKRSKNAPFITTEKPNLGQIHQKASRFDIYSSNLT